MYSKREILNRFVVLEGIDSSGKSTQSNELTSRLRHAGHAVLQTGEPTQSPYGKIIRKILASQSNLSSQYLALLYAADRALHLYETSDAILPAIRENEWVVCSRYLFSSFAYQLQHATWKEIDLYNRYFPLPRYLVYLDLDVELAIERITKRNQHQDIFERREVLEKVYLRYQKVLKQYQKQGVEIHKIDASQDIETVAQSIWDGIWPHINS